MGKEATCRVRFRGQEWLGKAHLDENQITIRGDHRVVAPLARKAQVQGGWLDIPTPEGDLKLELGPDAEKWAHAICNPKALIDKLGLTPDTRTLTIGFHVFDWLDGLPYKETADSEEFDAILIQVESTDHLTRVQDALPTLAPKGMIWIVFPKGRNDIKESQVFAAGKAAGLVDVKVCRFNAALTGLKFVRARQT